MTLRVHAMARIAIVLVLVLSAAAKAVAARSGIWIRVVILLEIVTTISLLTVRFRRTALIIICGATSTVVGLAAWEVWKGSQWICGCFGDAQIGTGGRAAVAAVVFALAVIASSQEPREQLRYRP